jgi:short-subunit dehydrogenase involved in D-alanine esterification of teichoic acids
MTLNGERIVVPGGSSGIGLTRHQREYGKAAYPRFE